MEMEEKEARFPRPSVVADFFDEMAKMARDVLKPSDQGGLGARTGSIKYVRLTPAAPGNPWEPPGTPTRTEIPVRAQAFGMNKQLVGTQIENNVLMATDLYVICERIPNGYDPADIIEIDGVDVTILGVQNIPAAGIVSAVKFFVRR